MGKSCDDWIIALNSNNTRLCEDHCARQCQCICWICFFPAYIISCPYRCTRHIYKINMDKQNQIYDTTCKVVTTQPTK